MTAPDRPSSTAQDGNAERCRVGRDASSRTRATRRGGGDPSARFLPTTTQVYVAASADGAGFGLTLVRGGDAEYDHTAIHVADASGRAPDPHTATSACLFAATAALELLATEGPQPLILRLGDRGATAIASGAWQPALHSRLRTALDKQLRATHQRIGQPVWVAGYDASRLMPWGERATAAASYGESHGHWGRLPQPLTAALPTAPATPPWWEDVADRECPVCIDTMTEPWPSPEDLSRAPPGRWACSHAICRGCDARTQHAPNDRCPLCRAPRKVRMRP